MIIAPIVEQNQKTEPRVHPWTREEYYRLGDLGLFDGKRVELIEGIVIDMGAIGTAHASVVAMTDDALRDAFGAGWAVRVQSPLALGTASDPEPDLVVAVGQNRDYRRTHPTTAALVVEVSDTTLDYDQKAKASLYAKSGIADYWILNLQDLKLEVRREPKPDPNSPSGFSYASIDYFQAGDVVSPLAKPEASIALTDLLP